MFMRMSPLALAISHCFCLDCQHTYGDWGIFFGVGFDGGLFHLGNTGSRHLGKLLCTYFGILPIEENTERKITAKNFNNLIQVGASIQNVVVKYCFL